ncbi:alpha/beta hydrolase family protein [Arenimonas composti]|uniref:AB hydrolase-1 domain-containing protein n=1 Tax=Arenimonas composti TR7-09 = DSM 18010 TaxID=1121013 RepID=A0A091BB16_9GAMM|nr:alpha/beta hydrolase [Arenimonas composti]KFN48707.1 hypothetical protein P873_13705 [Arenimonas composti TR7-09 = DSM 18010]
MNVSAFDDFGSTAPGARASRSRGLALGLAIALGLAASAAAVAADAAASADHVAVASAAAASPAAAPLTAWPANAIKRYMFSADDLAAVQARFVAMGAAADFAVEAPPSGGTRFFTITGRSGNVNRFALEQDGDGKLHAYAVRLRPQHPVVALPYREQEVVFATPTPGVAPVGTLTYPMGPGPFPAVVLVAGTGPHTRGVGLTGGEVHPGSTTDDYASDALAAVRFLRMQPFVDGGRVGLAGHSEGGIIAAMVAADAPEDVAFIVLLGGTGLPGIDNKSLQDAALRRAEGMDEALIAMNRDQERELLEIAAGPLDHDAALAAMHAATAALPEDVRTTLELPADGLPDEAFEWMLSPWYRRFLALDPRAYLREVKVPVLALIGSKDLQVPPAENLAELRRVLAGNPRAEVRELPGLNHNFQTANTGSPAEYFAIEETFSRSALELMTEWMRGATLSDE